MKEFRIKLYNFDELSEEVRKELIEKNRWSIGDHAMEVYSDERRCTLKRFEEIFGISVKYEVSYCGRNYSVYFDDSIFYGYNDRADWDIPAEEVKGKLLLRFLNSKYYDLWVRKRFWGEFKWDENGKSLTKTRYSKIMRISECPLTGVCYDEDILDPIREFLKKPDMKKSLADLIDDCVGGFIESWYKEWEYCCDNEDFLAEEYENLHEDDYFLADGTIFQGDEDYLEELAA